MSGRGRAAVAVALALRLLAVAVSARLVADVLRYHKVADWILDGSWNPYLTRRLYPYPPVWVWFEAASAWLASRLGLPFPVLVKLPVVLADTALVALLALWPASAPSGPRTWTPGERAAWLYALHPVALLVAGFHGQFDSLMLLCVLLALRWRDAGRPDAAALALAAAIGLKSFPVLLLPLFLWGERPRTAARFAALALGPVILILLPYTVADLGALRRELLGYGGVADFGWIGLWRGWEWWRTGVLARSEAEHWPRLVPLGKILFLIAYGLLLWRARSAGAAGRPRQTQAVFLAFLAAYGALSAQYLLWVVPLGALLADAGFLAYSVSATVALLGFYSFLQPAILWAGESPLPPALAGRLWVAGTAAVLVCALGDSLRLQRSGESGFSPH